MPTNYHIIKTAEDLRRAVDRMWNEPAVGLDTETTDLDPYTSRLRLIQLATPASVAIIYLDAFSTSNGNDLAHHPGLEPLRRLLDSPRPVKIAHNAKFDATFIKHTIRADL